MLAGSSARKTACARLPPDTFSTEGGGRGARHYFLFPFSDKDPERRDQREVRKWNKTLKGSVLKDNFIRLHQIVLNVRPPALGQDAEHPQSREFNQRRNQKYLCARSLGLGMEPINASQPW